MLNIIILFAYLSMLKNQSHKICNIKVLLPRHNKWWRLAISGSELPTWLSQYTSYQFTRDVIAYLKITAKFNRKQFLQTVYIFDKLPIKYRWRYRLLLNHVYLMQFRRAKNCNIPKNLIVY